MKHQTRQETEIPDLFRLGPQVAAIDEDLAAGGLVQAVHVGDEGALAGTGGTDDADEIALFHLEAHIVQRGDGVGHAGVIHIAQMFDFDGAQYSRHLLFDQHLEKMPKAQKVCFEYLDKFKYAHLSESKFVQWIEPTEMQNIPTANRIK